MAVASPSPRDGLRRPATASRVQALNGQVCRSRAGWISSADIGHIGRGFNVGDTTTDRCHEGTKIVGLLLAVECESCVVHGQGMRPSIKGVDVVRRKVQSGATSWSSLYVRTDACIISSILPMESTTSRLSTKTIAPAWMLYAMRS